MLKGTPEVMKQPSKVFMKRSNDIWWPSDVSSPGVPPNKAAFIDDLVVMLPQNVWDHLYSRY